MKRSGWFLVLAFIVSFAAGLSAPAVADTGSETAVSKILLRAYDDPNPELWARVTPGEGTELGNGRHRTGKAVEMKLEDAKLFLGDKEVPQIMLAIHPAGHRAWVVMPAKEQNDILEYAPFWGKDNIVALSDAANIGQKRIRVLPWSVPFFAK